MSAALPLRGRHRPRSAPRRRELRLDRDDWLVRGLIALYGLVFLLALVLPLGIIVWRSLSDFRGDFVGLENYRSYFATPALMESIGNTFFVAGTSTVIVVALAFAYAYALTRTRMPFKGFFKVMALVPLLSPSLLKAIALVYWFGNQGVLNALLMGESIYGPIGIIMASVFWTFPHAVLILLTTLALTDGRLYEAAEALKTSQLRTFLTVTLPGARYGLISAAIVVFILVLTDFGVPKVIGGNYNVLATDIYKEVVGQQNFEMGAVVSVVLLIPALAAFVIDRLVRRRQGAQLSTQAVPYVPKPSRWVDLSMLAYCTVVCLIIVAMLGMAQFAALVRFWPYNLELTLAHYFFDVEGAGWQNFRNSLVMAFWVASLGSVVVFVGAYLVEKPRRDPAARQLLQVMSLLPMAVPGLVLGLAYLLFINHPSNPLNFLYGTMAILVINATMNLYTVAHLTSLAALKQLDREFESVASSLKVSLSRSFRRVTVPVCLPALLDVWIYFFLSAMTTVSSVIFLYGSQTKLASVAAIHLDEAGRAASAAAMAMLIVYACIVVRLLHVVVARLVLRPLQGWRGG